jgi:peptide/nickel transport system substrate-binding protein
LRKGVKFHDGKPFTAKDVKYSLEYFADPQKSALAPLVEMMQKVEMIDDHTVKAYLKYPHYPFILYLSFPYCVMLPAHLANVNPKTPEFLIGTGPFKFKQRVPGKVWIYERNPDYFLKGLPYLDGVEVYPLPWMTCIDAFVGGRLSMAASIRYGIEEKAALDKLRRHAPEAAIKVKSVGVFRGVQFNVAGLKGHKGAWQDKRVRKAMVLATDFPGSITAGQGTIELGINSGVVPPYISGALSWKEVEKAFGIDKPMDARLKEAKRLMKEAGYADGFKAEMISRTSNAYLKAAEFLIQEWRKNLNIDVALKPMDNAVLFPRRDAGEFDLMYEGSTGMYGAIPEETLTYFLTKAKTNYGDWSNPEYDKLYDTMIKEPNPKKREEISLKMQRIFLDEVPFLINVLVSIGTAHRPTLHGHVMHPGHTGWAAMDRMWLEK